MAIMWRFNAQTQTYEKVWNPDKIISVGQNTHSGLWFAVINNVSACATGFPTKESAMAWADDKARGL